MSVHSQTLNVWNSYLHLGSFGVDVGKYSIHWASRIENRSFDYTTIIKKMARHLCHVWIGILSNYACSKVHFSSPKKGNLPRNTFHIVEIQICKLQILRTAADFLKPQRAFHTQKLWSETPGGWRVEWRKQVMYQPSNTLFGRCPMSTDVRTSQFFPFRIFQYLNRCACRIKRFMKRTFTSAFHVTAFW